MVTKEALDIAQNMTHENAEVICANDEIFIRVKLPSGEHKIFKAQQN